MARRPKSIMELRRELAAREAALAPILAHRGKLMAEVTQLDKKIRALGGEIPPARRGPGRPPGRKSAPKPAVKPARKPGPKPKAAEAPPKPKAAEAPKVAPAAKRATGKPLVAYIADALKDSPGMRVRDVMVAVQQAGYHSASKKFYDMVAAAIRDKAFQRVKRGVYKLAE